MFEADRVKVSWYDSVLSNTVGVVYSATTGEMLTRQALAGCNQPGSRSGKREHSRRPQTATSTQSRARPTSLYVCNVILAWNYILVPMLGRKPIEFPEPPLWLFGSVMLGYVGARS